ncbi:MAG TPA: FMN-binding protein [Patescibacteria group bacterium]
MKKYLLASFVIMSFLFYSIHEKSDNALADIKPVSVPVTPTDTPQASPTAGSDTTNRSSNVSAPTNTPVPKSTGQYRDGSYTGDTADAYYGNIQVEAVIQNGKIAKVNFLQYPNDRDTSRMINGQAMPILTQEAISAQNAQVDGVSGATDTSQAFVQSLTSALAKAK